MKNYKKDRKSIQRNRVRIIQVIKKCPFYGHFFITENILKTFHRIQFSLVFIFLSKIYEKLAKFTGNS